MALCNEDRIGEVIDFAETKLDLGKIATGAADEMGLGRGFEQHSCLDYILQELRRFPGRGERLIGAGLKSPVVRNRNMAIAALAALPQQKWSSTLEQALRSAIEVEPDENVRTRMQKVLRGEPLD